VIGLAAALLVLSPAAFAQHVHDGQSTPAPMILGSERPDLIKDITAYRLWFLALADDQEKGLTERQQARFNHDLKFTDQEARDTSEVLSEFKVKYAAFIEDNHNRTAHGEVDTDALIRRDQIVQEAIDKIQGRISSQSFETLHNHVVARKAFMRITPQEAAR
jgi:hypothetical protein